MPHQAQGKKETMQDSFHQGEKAQRANEKPPATRPSSARQGAGGIGGDTRSAGASTICAQTHWGSRPCHVVDGDLSD